MFLHFDLGTSYFQNQSVMSGILYRLPYTFIVATICMLLQIVIGTPLGITAAGSTSERNRRPYLHDHCTCRSFHSWFLLACHDAGSVFLCKELGWLPPYGVGGLQYFILPCIANAFAGIASQARRDTLQYAGGHSF
ncbi:MAG: hypothetical protein ACLU9T_07075 [Blautia faecis]